MKKQTRPPPAASDEDVSRPQIVLPGSLVGQLPARLTRELQSLSGAVLIDATRVEHVDTPAVEALRALLTETADVRVLLSSRPGPISHLLRTGLVGVAQFDLESGPIEGERRRHHRYTTRLELQLTLVDGQVLSGTSENVSCGGLRALLRAPRARSGSRTNVHGTPPAFPERDDGPISIDLPALGLKKRLARVIAREAGRLRLAFAEPCENLFNRV